MAFRNLVMHSLMASCVCAVLIPDLTLASVSYKDLHTKVLGVHIEKGMWGYGHRRGGNGQ